MSRRFWAVLYVTMAILGCGTAAGQADDAIGAGELRICGTPDGPIAVCPLKHTDVQADISGLFSRVTVRQIFENNTAQKIEAIYVFPLPAQAAVDDMTMTVGNRRIVGQIKTRDDARKTYEAAIAAGQVASLLDQERPNIFTQTIGNIEPGAVITIDISYVDTLKFEDGQYEFSFPMVVGPRYIPGGGSAPAPMTTGTPTPQVPDAHKITPPVVGKGMRAGHDISLSVSIDGGSTLFPPSDIRSELHAIETLPAPRPGYAALRLANQAEIPNRDFILRYRLGSEEISDAFFLHQDERGQFFSLILQPPRRVVPANVVSRELVFVLDTSGSMSGLPIEKAKQVMSGLIDTMNPGDTFNMITFSGDTHVLWPQPRPSTKKNRDEAQKFLAGRRGSGGTEMMKAINAALVRPDVAEWPLMRAADLAEAPPDGRKFTLRVPARDLSLLVQDGVAPTGFDIPAGPNRTIRAIVSNFNLKQSKFDPRSSDIVEMRGVWTAHKGRPTCIVEQAEWPAASPDIRVVCFFTDGYVGNDMAIIDAVKKNAAGTRVFSFGVGNSVNRFLLDGMAHAGRGEVEYVTLNSEKDDSIARFQKRILAPVLTDVDIDWGTMQVSEVYPKSIPDLFSARPVVVHGRLSGRAMGNITLRGNTGAGGFERVIPVQLGAVNLASQHPALPSLWARAKIEDLMNQDLEAMQRGAMPEPLKSAITELGLAYRLMTQFTSFVAVEEMTITRGGKPVKVLVPVEMPDGVSHEGVFGGVMGEMARRGRAAGSKLSAIGYAATPAKAAPTGREQKGRGGALGGVAGRAPQREKVQRVKEGAAPAPMIGQRISMDADRELSDDDKPASQPLPKTPADKLATELRGLAERVAKEGKDGTLTAGKVEVAAWKVDVMITLTDTSQAALDALFKAGFEVPAGSRWLVQGSGVSKGIGVIDVRKLADLAALAGVVRVELLPTP